MLSVSTFVSYAKRSEMQIYAILHNLHVKLSWYATCSRSSHNTPCDVVSSGWQSGGGWGTVIRGALFSQGCLWCGSPWGASPRGLSTGRWQAAVHTAEASGVEQTCTVSISCVVSPYSASTERLLNIHSTHTHWYMIKNINYKTFTKKVVLFFYRYTLSLTCWPWADSWMTSCGLRSGLGSVVEYRDFLSSTCGFRTKPRWYFVLMLQKLAKYFQIEH